MQPGPPRRRPARPVADAPIGELLPRTEELTKGWLLAVLERAPLAEAPGVLAADIADQGPRLCEALLRALADDRELQRIEPEGSLAWLAATAGRVAGAGDSIGAIRAVGCLQGVIWSALWQELRDPDAELVARLAERLARVIEVVYGAVLARGAAVDPSTVAGGESATGRLRAVRDAVATADPEPVRDELWLAALDEEVSRAQGSSAALSLLLIELEETDRPGAVEPGARIGGMFGRFAQAVRSALRRQDVLACESGTRAWVIARDTGRAGGYALGTRIAHAVSAAETWGGAPRAVSVGLAVLGEDGSDCRSLLEAAESAAAGVLSEPGGA
jgi:GGDEF domain-containing protein